MTVLEHATREEWLAQRRDYITATDVARLATSPAAWPQVRAEKAGASRDVDSAEMEWGRLREAALVAYAQSIDSTIEPNDRVHVDGRWAATPDGVGDGVVCECKTGSEEGLARARRRYVAQCQWQMLVTGARACLLVSEVRHSEEGLFSPGPRTAEWVDRDDNLIAELVDTAERFLAGDDHPELDVLIAAVVDVKAEEEKVRARRVEAEEALRGFIGDRDFSHEGPFGRVSLTLPKPRETLDTKRLRAERPEVAAEFTTVAPAAKRTLRVSEVA